jgi:hypothetical protein
MRIPRRVPRFILCALIGVCCIAFAQDRNARPAPDNTSASASLLARLKAARVKSNPEPLVIGGQQVCPASGNAKGQNMTTLDSRKNRVDIPAADAYIPIDWNVMANLPSSSPDDLQGAPVMVEGYLSHRIKVQDEKPGESANCNLLNDAEVDWHIYLTNASNQPIAKAIIVETTPRTRPLHHWNQTALEQLVNKDKKVRISGWLMYDFQHVSEIGTERISVWEVHPITRIEVSDGNGGWKNVE